jgi:rSAM/selenodomain-associated transferase 2
MALGEQRMISVIIPTLDEEKSIPRCLKQFAQQAGSHEIIVVDGGSQDNTEAVVREFPEVTLILTSKKGRGRQMNQGARAARGNTLLFLHADTLLPPGGLRMINAIMGRDNVLAGSFSLSFDHPDPFLKLFAKLSQINHILFTYGDQGFFIDRRTFEHLGGYEEMPLMEDVEIQQRLRKIGRFVKLNTPVVTSARRFLSNGIVRQQLLNTALVLLYHAGISPVRLKRFYV